LFQFQRLKSPHLLIIGDTHINEIDNLGIMCQGYNQLWSYYNEGMLSK
jgi:hypothetical protein